MSAILSALWGRASGWFAGLGVMLAALAAIWLKGRRDGIAAMKDEQERERRRAIEVRRKADAEIDAMDDPAVGRQLDRWLRDRR